MAESRNDEESQVGEIQGGNATTFGAAPPSAKEEPVPESPRYSVYSSKEKWFLVATVSAAGLFSPLTANIYFPAIPVIVNAFHKSTELINLTVTVYMVLQGVSPMLWGTLSDTWGRRPMFLACLFVLSGSCVGLALVPTSAYWLLMLLRCIQAAGSASTTTLGAAVIADIAIPAERGGFFGLYSLGPLVGPAIGPVIGGALSDGLGWRAIFWFLCISSAVCLVFMYLLFPETLRLIVGDGGIIPSARIYRPVFPILTSSLAREAEGTSSQGTAMGKFPNPLRILTYPDVVALLVFNGIMCAVFYAVTASLSTLFTDIYPFLDQTRIGLCFLAIGGGAALGTIMTGRFLNREYQSVKEELVRKAMIERQNTEKDSPTVRVNIMTEVTKDEHFPIERARLRTVPIFLGIYCACTIGYGWCLHSRVSLAGPLILQIIIGLSAIAVINTTQTLLIDLLPSQGSSVMACNNLHGIKSTAKFVPFCLCTSMTSTKERSPQRTSSNSDSEPEAEVPYSVYSRKQKWFIVATISIAGLFSPLTANIYFPAIPVIANAFHKSTELINLTVTVYMVLQGVSPMFWGALADTWGRRPMFLACLLVLSGSCIGLALVPTSEYWLLMLLRCIQAAGSASTIALGAGVIGDIAVPAERGGFFGAYSLGPLIGPAIGPVIGGALSDGLGWRSIFWFLCISSVVCFIFILLLFPETLRMIVGNGSIRPSRIYRPIFPLLTLYEDRKETDSPVEPSKPTFRNPLRILTYPDVVTLLFFNGIVYSVFYGVTASLSTLFTEVYPFLDQTRIGLCFLAIGGGASIGTVATGRLLDKEYQSIKRDLVRNAIANRPIDAKVVDVRVLGDDKTVAAEVTKDENFPIEKARLRTVPYFLALYVGCVMGYGWCLQKRVSIAGPLVLQAIIGYISVAIMNTTQTLLVDWLPSQGSSVTACNNLVRCSLGASLVAVIDVMLRRLTPGWTYLLLGGACILISPLILVIRWIGPRYRAKRRAARL
ncbi:hypothetical protein ONZ45_g3423 [Pleurotus djamor]|nr:hypothetical protein ONZ45_g3423 [Pleurotus djamor]